MQLEITKEKFFPTCIYTINIPDYKDWNGVLLNRIQEEHERDSDGLIKSNINGWHSQINIFEWPECQTLVSYINTCANKIYQDHGYSKNFISAISSMWANILPYKGYNRRHAHANSFWSGVYYVQCNKDSGKLEFVDPRAGTVMFTPYMDEHLPVPQDEWRSVWYEPVEGKLILFPSWLSHEVFPNLSEQDRISISFNLTQTEMSKTSPLVIHA